MRGLPNREMTMNVRNISLLILASGSIVPTGALADIVTHPIAGRLRQSYTGAQTIQVPRFDPSLGTLNSVAITVNPEISGTIEGTATGPANSPNGWVVEFAGNLRLTGPGFNPVTRSASFGTRSGTVFQPGTPIFQFFGPSVRSITVDASDSLASYTGTGTTSLSLSWPEFDPLLFFSRSGRLDRTTRDLGSQEGLVTYNFTSVPEPTAAGVLGIVGLFAIRRRNRQLTLNN